MHFRTVYILITALCISAFSFPQLHAYTTSVSFPTITEYVYYNDTIKIRCDSVATFNCDTIYKVDCSYFKQDSSLNIKASDCSYWDYEPCDTVYKVDCSYWNVYLCDSTYQQRNVSYFYVKKKDSSSYNCGYYVMKKRKRTWVDKTCWTYFYRQVLDSTVTYTTQKKQVQCSTYVSQTCDVHAMTTCPVYISQICLDTTVTYTNTYVQKTCDSLVARICTVTYPKYCDSIVVTNPKFSVAGLGSFGLLGANITPIQSYDTKMHRITMSWKDVSTGKGTYNWTPLDSYLKSLADAGKVITIEYFAGDLCPQWVYDTYGKFMTQGGNRNGPWPDYRNEQYWQAWFQWNRDLQAHILTLSPVLQERVMCLLVDFFSTGDLQPYKGTPINYQPITSDEQDKMIKRSWDSIYAVSKRNGETYALGFNAANDYEYFDYFYDKYKDLQKLPMFKIGQASHFSKYDGNSIKIGDKDTVGFGEGQYPVPQGLTYVNKQLRALSYEILAMDIESFQIAPNWWQSAGTAPTAPINEYFNHPEKGFFVPSGCLDYADKAKFPESTFGNVIKPGSETQFNQQVSRINQMSIGARAKQMLIYNSIRTFINYDRINKILLANPDARYDTVSYTTDPNYKEWDNDIFIDAMPYYQRSLAITDPDNQITIRRRFAADTSMWGVAGFKFKNIGIPIDFTTGITGNSITVTVHYLDEGIGKWSLNGTNFSGTITNTNTGQIKDYSATFQASNVAGKDFWLNWLSGDNVTFAGVEIVKY